MMDCEIYGIVRAMLRGIPVDDETLALEAIAEVGPAADYLTHPHTRKHMRELFRPRYLDRRTIGAWESEPERARDRARARAQELLRTHQPEPLDPGLSGELDRIIAAVEREVPA